MHRLLAGFSGKRVIYDVETYPNYILLKSQDLDTGTVIRFVIDETRNEGKAAWELFRACDVIVGYNNHAFDDVILDLAFKGVDSETVYELADMLINNNTRRGGSPFIDRWGEPKNGCPLSIDLAMVLRHKIGEKGGRPVFGFPSLKHLGNRFGYRHLQTLPIAPGTILTDDQKALIDRYNDHDLAITRLLLTHLDAALEMRRVMGENYGVNLTSRADAKLAEMIVSTAYTNAINAQIMEEWQHDDEPDYYKLEPPRKSEWVCGGSDILSKHHEFREPELVALVNKIKGWTLHWRRVTDATGNVTMEKPSFGAKVPLGGKVYSVMLGGIHSEDEPLVISADNEYAITDIDVSSYYPGLVVNERIAPGHLDADIFCGVFGGLMEARLDAKARAKRAEPGAREMAEGLKVAINSGGFGKLTDPWSPFRDPPKGAQITINGQLILLRLIEEMLTINGVRVLSANTDGILVHHPRWAMDHIYAAMKRVQEIYSLNKFDVIEVQRLCRASINEYVLSYVDENGKIAVKGRGSAFNDGSGTEKLDKKTDKAIVKKALISYLLFDTPIEQTVKDCTDLIQFCDYTTLDGVWTHIEDGRGNRLSQRTNRWYESIGGTTLHKVRADGSRQKIPRTQAVTVANDIPDVFPLNVNYDYYIAAAQEAADAVLNPKPKGESRRKKAEKLSDDERDEWEDRINQTDADVDWLTGLDDLNHYRDLYVGRVALNAYDSMRAALKALWKSRLGLTKADLIWSFESFNTADGKFNRHDKRKSMLSYIDWVVNNVVPYEMAVFPEDTEADVSVQVKVLDGEPGAGKTRRALQAIVNGGPKVFWWAINKIDPIARERRQELMELAVEAGVTVDFMAIHTGGEGRGNMKMRIDNRMVEIKAHPKKDETIFVTLITHKTLVDHYLDGVSGTLLIDEPIQVWEQHNFDFGRSHRTVRSLLTPAEIGEDYDPDLNGTIDADTQAIRLVLTDEGRREYEDTGLRKDSIRGGRHRWIIDQAGKTSGRVFAFASQWNQLDEDDGGDLTVIAMLHPAHIAHFDETWMMAAYFKELIIYRLWSDLYDVEWQFDTHDDGWKRQVPLADRVNLYYILGCRQVSDKYLRSDPRHALGMAMAVKEFYGDAPYIWSVGKAHKGMGEYGCLPTHVLDRDGGSVDAYLTPKANGINQYQNVHGAAWLGSIKLPGDLLTMLKRVWGKPEAEWCALREFELYSVMQFLARTNSRRFDSTDQVRHVVADYVQAQYIAEMWNLPADRVQPLPMRDEVRTMLDDHERHAGGRKTSVNLKGMSADERREYERKSRAERRAKKQASADSVTITEGES